METLLPYLSGIGLAYTVFVVAMMSPGPNILAVIGTSMAAGRREGMALALGVAFGSLLWAILSLIGLTALLTVYAQALTVLKIAGGLYLLWLAFKALRSAASRHDLEARTIAGKHRSLLSYGLRGLIIQMTNPKAALAWIAIISLGTQNQAPISVGAAIVIGTFILSIVLHLIYAILFSTQRMVRIYSRARRGIQAVLGVVFGFAGLRLLSTRL
jgi:threonine/homoserine/homoserine lactone efflux protein